MKTYAISILPAQWADEAARTAASMNAAMNDEEIIASEQCPHPGPHSGADIQAIRDKSGNVFARLLEYRLDHPGRLVMGILDEKDGIPEHRTAPLSVFATLTPTEDHASLKWRDISRQALALAGHFKPQVQSTETGTKPTGAGEQRERVLERAEIQRAIQNPDDQNPSISSDKANDALSSGQSGDVKKRITLLVDRAPQVLTASSTNAKFLKFTAFALDGAAGFVKVVLFRGAEIAAEKIARAISESGTAKIDLDGTISRASKKFVEVKADKIVSIDPTERKIPETEKSKSKNARQLGDRDNKEASHREAGPSRGHQEPEL